MPASASLSNQAIALENLFDPDFYRASNADLRNLTNQQALQHWRTNGIAEGRSFSPLIDLNFYRANNADLAGLNNRQLLDQFANVGLNQGRVFSPFVDLKFYRASNPDLNSFTNPQLLDHLNNFGLKEGRAFSPFVDVNFYRASNPDLNSFTNRQLFNHLVGFGVNEGRVFSPFVDLNFYRANNRDLAGLNNRQLWEHFSRFGLAEGRPFSPIPYNSRSGYGLVNAAAAVGEITGQSRFTKAANLGSATSWDLDAIAASQAWNQGYTGQGVVVAVVDTGVDSKHIDLDNNIWSNPKEIPGNGLDDDGNGFVDDVRGWDFVNKDNDPMDLQGHGTHVAGTIAAENNGVGITGVAYNAKIMPVRVLDASGQGLNTNIAAGIRYAADNQADIINLSLGSSVPSPEITQAIRYAFEKGSVVVTAAGNDGDATPDYPARYATHFGITVGAVNSNKNMAGFSDRAGTIPLDYVVAPGVNIYSTLPGNTYGFESGTSMAAPHVSGVVALLLSANPNLSPVMVERILTETANSSGVGAVSATSSTTKAQNSGASAAILDSVTGSLIDPESNHFISENRAVNDVNEDAIAHNLASDRSLAEQSFARTILGNRGDAISHFPHSTDWLGNPAGITSDSLSILQRIGAENNPSWMQISESGESWIKQETQFIH